LSVSESQPFAPSLTEYQIRVLLIDDQAMVGETVRRMLAPEAGIVSSARVNSES